MIALLVLRPGPLRDGLNALLTTCRRYGWSLKPKTPIRPSFFLRVAVSSLQS
jgi:hypothetical protein